MFPILARAVTRIRILAAAAAAAAAAVVLSLGIAQLHAEQPVKISLLATYFRNDNAQWIPTTDAEIQRMADTRNTFTDLLSGSGKYELLLPDPSLQEAIDKSQRMGSCAGCEFRFGQQLGVEQVAWIEVQKVSELILNMNVYIGDVRRGQLTFVKSVDMRGNSDTSWERAIHYLVTNYLL